MEYIPLISLVVAALAVFVGPMISLRVAERQTKSSLEVANKQITAPMRQAWINNLRDLLAELTSSALDYFNSGKDEMSDEAYRWLTLLEHKVQLMLNPDEEDHKLLEQLIGKLLKAIDSHVKGQDDCMAVIDLSRKVLKREWDRVKEPITIVLSGRIKHRFKSDPL